ncbi:hypothetical protein ACGFI9_13600 [Micromonospora sp. NPDC048930]|uniref:hypothetical protein n=1 Tax=Micromonospora sp. NPDC048930 TaxID=3364261 RepID=UPI003710F6E6
MAAERKHRADDVSFEDLLACPHLQFDPQDELLPHLIAFAPAEPGPAVAVGPAAQSAHRPWLFDAVTSTTIACA